MGQSKLKTSILAIGIVLGTAGLAQAACVQADAAGNWQVYSLNSDGFVTRCKIAVNSSGLIGANSCTQYSGSNSGSGSMTSAKVNLVSGSTCTFSGTFKLGGTTNTIRQMTLSKDKISGEGIGTYSGGTFLFSMTKL